MGKSLRIGMTILLMNIPMEKFGWLALTEFKEPRLDH